MDRQTRSELIEIQIPNPSRRLASWMYAQLSVPVSRGHASQIVAGSSVANHGKMFVVKVENEKTKCVNVRKCLEAYGKTEIFDDVKKVMLSLKQQTTSFNRCNP